MIPMSLLLTAPASAPMASIWIPRLPAASGLDVESCRQPSRPRHLQEMDKLTGSVRVFARAKPEDGLDAIDSVSAG